MLNFVLYLNMGLNLFIKIETISLNWWCHLHVGRYCWIRSTILSYLFILGMDFINGLPSCTNGCNAIFTCVDYLTKYIVLTACTLGAGQLSAKKIAQ